MKKLKFLNGFLLLEFFLFNSFAQYYEDYELAPFEQNGKFGYVLSYTNEIVIPCQYEAADYFAEGLARVKKDGKYGFIDKWGILQIDCQYEYARSFYEGMANVKKDGLWGFIDYYNNPVIDLKYELATNFAMGYAAVMKNGKYGYINQMDEVVLDFMFDKANPIIETSASVMLNDTVYTIEFPRMYRTLSYPEMISFYTGSDISGIYESQKWSLFNTSNIKTLTSDVYDDIRYFSEGLIAAKLGEKWGFIDTAGNVAIDFQYTDAGNFRDELANVKQNGKWGYINSKNSTIISFQYDYASSFYKDLAWVVKDNIVHPIDRSGSRQSSDQLMKIIDFSEGFAAVIIEDKFGFINTTGEIVIPPRFIYAGNFHSGRAKIFSGLMFGYIDRNGKSIIKDNYYSARDFYDGAAIVWGESKFGYEIIDTMGNILNDYQFLEIRPFRDGLAAASDAQSPEIKSIYDFSYESSKWGYINTNGNIQIDYQFEWAGNFNHGFAHVARENEIYFIDKTGSQVSQKFYDLQSFRDFSIGVRMDENQQENEYAIIGHDGTILSEWFSYISGFGNGVALVAKDDRDLNFKALMDTSGTIISDFYYDISKFNWRLYLAEKKDSNLNSFYYFLDKTGKQTCEWFSDLRPVLGGYSIVTKYSDEFGLFYTMADPMTGALGKEWYQEIGGFVNGTGIAENMTSTRYGDAGFTCIDLKGKRLCGFYDNASHIGEGFCIVEDDDRLGLVTHSGLFPVWLTEYQEPAEEIAIIYAKKRYWIIDISGRLLTNDKRIREAIPFREGRAAVMGKKGLYGFIDTEGNQIIPFRYSDASHFSEGLAGVQNPEGKYGFIDKNGKVAVDFIFDNVNDFSEGVALVSKDGDDFYIDHNGNRVDEWSLPEEE